ncbi:MAG: sulfite exporter TauE/SafE family protein [Crocinitomicaceae bacterium]|nr:sulfite exporter TauE/SafE family protein [Crocinitomicaceae bacterium]
MEIIGLIAAVLIGLSLGLIGGGGSILTVPVLVYLFGFNTLAAITYSFFVVGSTSLVGSFSYFKKNQIDFKIALIFGIPSIIAIFVTRTFILPYIPAQLLTIGTFEITKNLALLLLFAVVMIWAAWKMLSKKQETTTNLQNTPLIQIFSQGVFVGVLTGLTGAGGGFLIIPVLVNSLQLPMKTAVGTSLLIISLNSLLGFITSLSFVTIDWVLLLSLTGIAIFGILIGSYLSTKVNGEKLKPAFGWFILTMGVYILLKETVFH